MEPLLSSLLMQSLQKFSKEYDQSSCLKDKLLGLSQNRLHKTQQKADDTAVLTKKYYEIVCRRYSV